MRLQPTNPMNRAMAVTLFSEVLVFLLAFPGMILVDHRSTLWSAVVVGVGCVMAVVAGVNLRKPWGYPLGWLTQLAGIAMGFMTAMMFGVGIIFLVIWAACFVMGKRIEDFQRRNAAQS